MQRFLIISIGTTLFLCSNSSKADGKETATIFYANYLENIAYSHLSKIDLEERGYKVEINFGVRLHYNSLAKMDDE